MAISEVYVDPSIAADSGTGTIGDPYGDLEYAIEQTTFDTTNGTRVNIKAGTAEVLAAEIATAMKDVVTTVAWAPSAVAPAIFQGYTAVAGDGGVAEIDGNGNSVINDINQSYVHLRDLKMHNCGLNSVVGLDNYCSVIRCEMYDGGRIDLDAYGILDQCYIHDIDNTINILISTGFHMTRCYVVNTKAAATTIQLGSASYIGNNILLGTTLRGIYAAGGGCVVEHNTIVSDATTTTGGGIVVIQDNCSISNNLIAGFNGVGGDGIELQGTDAWGHLLTGNAFYDCTNALNDGAGRGDLFFGADNEILTASPFNDAASGDYSPVDVGNVIEGALPQIIGGGLVV